MADQEILRIKASTTGLGLKYLIKDEQISIVLEQLRDIFPEAVFKGGTALNRVYLARSGVSRFSEDIDLDFISDRSFDENTDIIKDQMKKLKGFDVTGPRIQYKTLRFDCFYSGLSGERDRISIDFYVNAARHLKIEDVLVKSPFIESHPTIFKVYSLEDLIAQKCAAICRREEGKDIYDLFYALDMNYDKESLLKALKIVGDFYHIEPEALPDGLIQRLKDMGENARYISTSTSHFIPKGLRPDWKILIDTLIMKVEKVFQE